MRHPLPPIAVDTASDLLRWGANGLDDEQVWSALLAALDEASEDREFWALGDGFVTESVRVRPALAARWREARFTNPGVAAVHRFMHDPDWNYE